MKEEKTVGQITVEKNVGGIEGLCVITPAVHGDARGYFMETYNEREMKEAGFDIQFVQDNQSMSVKGVLRGLHFQINYPQCKLVRAVRGSVFDVAVDLRESSATYGKWYGVDPTNHLVVSDSHIRIGVGRDASECQINRGIVTGGGIQTLETFTSVTDTGYGAEYLRRGL